MSIGIRQRQEVWQRWIGEGRTIDHVMENLPEAHFDPEFFRPYEDEIIAAFRGDQQNSETTREISHGRH